MVKLYAKRIIEGKMTIDEVPERWRSDVEALLKEEK